MQFLLAGLSGVDAAVLLLEISAGVPTPISIAIGVCFGGFVIM